jgi:putative transposase
MSLGVIANERGDLSVHEACEVLDVARATYYRAQRPAPERTPTHAPRRIPRRLSDADRAAVLAVLHEERFVDQPPAEIVATLLSEGVYLASERTYYRLLTELAEVRERRAQRRHPPPVKPSLVARGPNEVWTWDITKLAGPTKGVFYYAYLMLDLFSRFVVGWLVAARESGALAAQWLQEIVTSRSIDASRLQVHNDRGAPMTSVPFTQLLERLGISPSLSRPRVSDDNPYSEAGFKTLKYQPDYPERFGSQLHAEAYVEEFVAWYNEVHHHAGLALFTPGQVYRGEVEVVAQRRQGALDHAYQAHPERFVRGSPRVRRPPAEVSINPLLSAAGMSLGSIPGHSPLGDASVPTYTSSSATSTASVASVASDFAVAGRGSVRRGDSPTGTPRGPRGDAAVDGPQRGAISPSDTQSAGIEVPAGRPTPRPERSTSASAASRRKAHK